MEKLVSEFGEDIIGVGGGIINMGDGLWVKSINLALDNFIGSANSIQGRYFKDTKYVKSISGCNSIYHKNDLLSVGGFDTKLSTAEDADLNKKLLAIGKLIYIPNAIVLHNHRRGLKAFAKRMYQYGYGRAKAQLWDLQVIPPLYVLILLLSLIVTPWLFISSFISYVLVIIATCTIISLKERKFKYFLPVAIVFVTEHTMYTIGFWRGFVKL